MFQGLVQNINLSFSNMFSFASKEESHSATNKDTTEILVREDYIPNSSEFVTP